MAEKSPTAMETHAAAKDRAAPQRQQLLVRSHRHTLLASPSPAGNGGSESIPPPGSMDQSPGAARGAPKLLGAGFQAIVWFWAVLRLLMGMGNLCLPSAEGRGDQSLFCRCASPSLAEMQPLGCVHRLVPICRHEVTCTLTLIYLLSAPSQALRASPMALPTMADSCFSILLVLEPLLPAAPPYCSPPFAGIPDRPESWQVRAAQVAKSKSGTSPALLHPMLPDAVLEKDPSIRAAATNSSSGS